MLALNKRSRQAWRVFLPFRFSRHAVTDYHFETLPASTAYELQRVVYIYWIQRRQRLAILYPLCTGLYSLTRSTIAGFYHQLLAALFSRAPPAAYVYPHLSGF